MPGENAFYVEGVVIEALPNGTYRVGLANGHKLTGFVAGRAKKTFGPLTPGSKVNLQLSPYDLSEGRILVETKTDFKNESSRVSKEIV
ncbi:MAG TPA: translation initiation factor IF-1 [Verrucomicrobiae bacterium]|nr:translation initiation factor IF-1 [Verrucomicrobiae bacterium]